MKKISIFVLLLFFFLKSYSQIVNIESYRMKDDTNSFFGNVGGEFSANKNDKTIYKFGLDLNLEYEKKRNTIMFIGSYDWVKTIDDNVKNDFINEGFQHIRYNYLLKPKWKLESFFQYQFNENMDLKQRDLVGLGFRHKIYDNILRLYLGSSVMYEKDITYSGSNVNYIKSSNYFSLNLFIGKNIKISNTSYFQFNLNYYDYFKYRVFTVLEATIQIYKRLYYKMDFNFQYDNDCIYLSPNTSYSTEHKISFSF